MTSKCTILAIKVASEVPTEPIHGKPTLVYWDIVGIVHPLRMALALAEVEWYDVRMVCGTSSDIQANKKEWYQAKRKLREKGILDFPNLPYYLDENNVQLVQTDAILRYLGNKYNLLTSSRSGTVLPQQQQYRTDMLLEEARDLDDTMVRLSYEQGGDAVAKWLGSEELRQKLTVWEGYLKANREEGHHKSFVMGGDALTVVDLKLYTFLYKFQHAQASLMVSSSCGSTPALPLWIPGYLERVKKSSPQLQAYLDSPDMQIPINNPHAKFDHNY